LSMCTAVLLVDMYGGITCRYVGRYYLSICTAVLLVMCTVVLLVMCKAVLLVNVYGDITC